MNSYRHFSLMAGLFVLLFAVGCTAVQVSEATPMNPAGNNGNSTPTTYLPIVLTPESLATERLQPADLVYLGAFRLPDSAGTPDDVGWEWGGTGLTYYADGDVGGPDDSYPGSLFGAGHNQTQYISEITIPVPVVSAAKDVNELNTAVTLQPFSNIRANLFDHLDWEIPRVGLAYLPRQGSQTTDKLYFSWATHAPGNDTDSGATHGWAELDLSAPQAAGIWSVGGYPKYVTSDYMFDIPKVWADVYTPGQYVATGRYRDGGQASEGPSLFAIAPWAEGNPPAPNSALTATTLLLYDKFTDENPAHMDNYHHSDEWEGAVWVTAGTKTAVLFSGTKGQGANWYGCADGTDQPPWPDDCNRGWWSSSFVGQILFYDPADFAAVAQDNMETGEPQPYATLDVDQYLYHIESNQQWHHLGAAGFDRNNGVLYIFEPHGDGDKPLVHVWRVN
ncbi:MAG: hypothetical protein GY796_16485 [Chloroflexi bacterium]|nr:hypothetical protein [Chloroflexota bacterium]